ncbi:hypothetical protein GCM10020260_17550 [Nesterenkonia halobia]|uniref:Uncharacterized protein n=1 Tax=Nesterenkonia halobia TaxID=37922 RepID=A0ABP6RCT2_9MICC
MLGGADGQDGAREPRGEPAEDMLPLRLAERRRRAQVQAELHLRVRGVDTLTARARRTGELLDQLSLRHAQAAGDPGARDYVQIIHSASVSHPGIRHMLAFPQVTS